MTEETYRFAYEEAHAELNDIVGQFELLQARKEQMEQVVEALRVVLAEGESGDGPVTGSSEQVPFLVHQSVELFPEKKTASEPEPAFEAEPAFAEQSSDPFQRRIDMALRHGLGARESRVLPRGLSGLLSRA